MGTNKLVKKLEDFLVLSKRKQREKQEKLLKIISKLEEKKAGIQHQMVEESERDETSERYHQLDSEIRVVNKLLKKAHKHVRNEDES